MRAKNKWGFGEFSDTVLFDASFKPEALTTPPETRNSGAMIEIEWSLPFNNGAIITAFEVLIQEHDLEFSENEIYCNGADAIILVARTCQIPLTVLREEPYLLQQNDVVKVQVRSYNYNGWSDYSDINQDGGVIQTEPAQVSQPRRGDQTSYNQVHIEWDGLVGDETGGSQITSYYLQWDSGTAETEWSDLSGLTSPHLLTYFIVDTDITPGQEYRFQVKAQNAHGFSTEWSPVGSAFARDKPDQPLQVATTIVNDVDVRVDWDPPYDGESPIQSYSILISDSNGNFISEAVYCSGLDPAVTHCDVPKAVLREDPFNLVQGDSVYAIVKAVNLIGEGSYSEPNSIGAIIEDKPAKMQAPWRGTLTSETQLQILWTELEGTDTGGTDIDSYNLRWDQGTDTWADMIGEDGNYLVASEHIQTDNITPGMLYKVTVRAHNSHGWGPESDYLEIVAAEGPETPDPPETFIHNHYVRIQWTAPYQNSAEINAYKVYIAEVTGTEFLQDTIYCDGSEEPILSNEYCEIPMSALRLDPYNLVFD